MQIVEDESNPVTMILNNNSGNRSEGVEDLATWGPFPNDILEEILSRLPVKALIQFSSVCKPWLSLISNPWFAKLHYNRATNERRTALIITAYDECTRKLHFLLVPRHNSGPVTHILTLDHTQITSNQREIMQAEHLNGLILFNSENGFVQNNFAFAINPSTRKLFKLPNPAAASSSYGKKEEVQHLCYFFGFNESTNEHKVLTIRMLNIVSLNPSQRITKLKIDAVSPFQPTIEIMIFSMSSLSWRKIDATLPFNVSGNHWYLGTKHSVCVNSVIYVMIEHLNEILAFDLRREKFSMINLPSDAINDNKTYLKDEMNIVTSKQPFLMKINGLLGLICGDPVAQHNNELGIWILQDYENPVWVRETVTYSDSWFLLDGPFIVNPVIFEQHLKNEQRFPRDVIRVPLYDMETRSMKHVKYVLGHQFLSSSSVRFDHVRSYVESLYYPLKSSPRTPPPTMKHVQEHVLDHQMESNDTFLNKDNLPSPEYQRMSCPVIPILPKTVKPDLELELLFTKEKGIDSSNLDQIMDHGRPSSPPNQTQPQESARSESEQEHTRDTSGPHVSYGLAPSSPPPVEPVLVAEQPRVKRRRIKYDKAIVLTNEFMKKSIDDPSDLKRKRKKVSSFLGVWKRNNEYKKAKVLFDPLITGLCDNHRKMFEEGHVFKNPNLIINEEPNPDAMEIRRSAGFMDPNDNNMLPINIPDNNRSFNSPRTQVVNTPAINSDIGSKLYTVQTSVGTGIGSTPDATSSMVSEMETPFLFSKSHHNFDNRCGGLSDIPEVDDARELACLEDDEAATGLRDTTNSPGQHKSPPDSGSLLPRTRAVAHYIKEKTTATPSTSENLGSVSIKSILEGKTRKVCSRFFFETLVLKSCDLVDAKQDEPYGDVTLKVTPKPSKLQLSN